MIKPEIWMIEEGAVVAYYTVLCCKSPWKTEALKFDTSPLAGVQENLWMLKSEERGRQGETRCCSVMWCDVMWCDVGPLMCTQEVAAYGNISFI
jgi:hypothetical protein